MIRWVFLDVGNILLDEDALTFHVFCRHVEAIGQVRPDRGFFDLLAEREAHAQTGSAWPLHDVASAYLDAHQCDQVWQAIDGEVRARYAELSPLIAGARDLVETLAARFRLGLIANQGVECRARLQQLGFWDAFDAIALSELEGLFKPDVALYRRALDRSGAKARECLMVGDRLDNDLAPAASLGMNTAWVRWPRRAEKGWDPPDSKAEAYLASLERSAEQAAKLQHLPDACLVFDTIAELGDFLQGAGGPETA